MSTHVKLPVVGGVSGVGGAGVGNEQAQEHDEATPPVVCAKLRTKMAFGSLSQVRDWRFGDSTTAAYWCLRTMEAWGTDDAPAQPHACRRGRTCFAAPPGSDEIA